MPSRVYGLGRTFFRPILCCALALAFCLPVLAHAVPGKSAQPTVLVEYLADADGTMTVQEAAAAAYHPFSSLFRTFQKLPGDFNGTVWLRFTLSLKNGQKTAPDPSPAPVYLDLGTGLPGVTRLYTPQRTEAAAPVTYWQAEDSASHVIFPLPSETLLPAVIYARLDGLPDLWFSPRLVPAPEDVPVLPLNLLLPGALAAALLMQLLRFSREGREWRLWAALLAGCGLFQFFFPALPAAGAAFAPASVCAMMAPGFALMLLSHIARHLFSTPSCMPGADKMLRLFPLVGAALALAPLAPDYLWLTRYLPFWPFLALPLLPFALSALSRGLSGALAFFCLCLMPIAGAAASLWETGLAGQPVMGPLGSLWGLALGSLALTLASAQEQHKEEDEAEHPAAAQAAPALGLVIHDDVFASLDRSSIGTQPSEEETLAPEGPVPPMTAADDAVPVVESQLPTASHAALPADAQLAEPEESATRGYMAKRAALDKPVAVPPVEPAPAFATENPADQGAQGENVAKPFADDKTPALAGEAQAPEENPEPETTPQPLDARASMFSALACVTLPPSRKVVFDLSLLIREVYEATAPLAEKKNMGLTWFISPQVGQMFEGEAALLDSALRLLLHDMVEVSERGTVRLSVRRLPDTLEAGNLMFTIADWDSSASARKRNLSGLAEAWALAEKTGGIFSVEHSSMGGTTVVFSSLFTPVNGGEAFDAPVDTLDSAYAAQDDEPENPTVFFAEEEAAATMPEARIFIEDETLRAVPGDLYPEEADSAQCHDTTDEPRDAMRVMLVDMASGSRKRFAQALTELPHTVLESADAETAVAMYKCKPAALVIVNADMPEADIAAMIIRMHRLDAAADRSPVPVLALVAHDLQAQRLVQAGAEETLVKPVEAELLLDMVMRFAPSEGVQTEAAETAETADSQTAILPVRTDPIQALHNALDDMPPASYTPEDKGRAEQTAHQEEQDNGPAPSARELPLLDLIITDIDPERDPERAVQPRSETARKALQENTEQKEKEEEKQEELCDVFGACDVDQTAGLTETTGAAEKNLPPSTSAQAPAAGGTANAAAEQPQQQTEQPPASQSITVPLPGESDSVFKDLLPLIPGLIYDLSDAMADAAKGKTEKDPLLVQQAAARVAGKAAVFGMAQLERIARCVERAAAADDVEPMECVLADLESWVTRYKEALRAVHRDAQW